MFALSLSAIFIFTYLYYTKDSVAFERISKFQSISANRYFSEDGFLVAEEYNTHRIYINSENIPEYLKLAFISAEDKNFYNHPGFDFKSIVRASSQNIYNYLFLRDKSRLIGASTITQQLIKNLLKDNERTIIRKLKEIILAIKLERELAKEKILELYLNEIYLGRGAFGIVAASEKYFGKTLSELDIEEMAMLAALPKAPSNYDPQDNYESIKERRDWVLERMADNGVITKVVSKVMQDSPINYQNKDEHMKVDVLSKKIKDKLKSQSYFDEDVSFDNGLTYFLTTNQLATNYVNKKINSFEGRHEHNITNIDIKIISLISGRTLVDIQNGPLDSNALNINLNEKSILKPIYFAGVVNSGIALNKKILAKENTGIRDTVNLTTVRNLYNSKAVFHDGNLQAKAKKYLLKYVKDIINDSATSISWNEIIELNLDQIISLFIPILSDGKPLETTYLDKIDDMYGNQIYLHKNADQTKKLESEIAFKIKSLLCDMDKVEMSENMKYLASKNCSFSDLKNDKFFYLKFSGNVAYFAIISGDNIQVADHLITLMNETASESLKMLNPAELKDFLIPDNIQIYKINKSTGNRYDYADDFSWEFF